jgi:hypothetical protein
MMLLRAGREGKVNRVGLALIWAPFSPRPDYSYVEIDLIWT